MEVTKTNRKKSVVLALEKNTTFIIFNVRTCFTLAIACVTILIYIVPPQKGNNLKYNLVVNHVELSNPQQLKKKRELTAIDSYKSVCVSVPNQKHNQKGLRRTLELHKASYYFKLETKIINSRCYFLHSNDNITQRYQIISRPPQNHRFHLLVSIFRSFC